MNYLTAAWAAATRVTGTPGLPVTVLTALLAAALVFTRQGWTATRHLITIAHEGGHALVGVACGRQLGGVRLETDTSGVTITSGRPSGPGLLLTLAAGYTAPALLAWGGSVLLWAGRTPAALWILTILLTVMLLWVRNMFGAFTVGATLAVTALALRFGTDPIQGALACLLVWVLAIGALRPVIELQQKRRREGAPTSDADQLAQATGIPGLFWVGVFGVVVLAANGFMVAGLTRSYLA